MASRFDRPELDALRFFAFCCVFCDHINLPYRRWGILHDMGAFGMSLFFLLSAYLIVTLLIREQQATETVNIRAFFVRRVLRIWPLYFSTLLFALVLGIFHLPGRFPEGALLALSLGVGNIWIAHHGWLLGWAQPLWSLSVEEQFYVGIPALVKNVRRSALVLVFCLIIAFSYPTLGWLSGRGEVPMGGIWTNSFVEFQFFAAGGLLALWHSGRKLRFGGVARVVLVGTGLALWAVAVHVYHLHYWTPIPLHELLAGYGCVLVGTLVLFLGVLDTGVHVPAAVRYLGKITYGLYIFHGFFLWIFLNPKLGFLPAAYAGRVALAALTTVAVAAISYQFFERPFLKLKYRFELVHSRPA